MAPVAPVWKTLTTVVLQYISNCFLAHSWRDNGLFYGFCFLINSTCGSSVPLSHPAPSTASVPAMAMASTCSHAQLLVRVQ